MWSSRWRRRRRGPQPHGGRGSRSPDFLARLAVEPGVVGLCSTLPLGRHNPTNFGVGGGGLRRARSACGPLMRRCSSPAPAPVAAGGRPPPRCTLHRGGHQEHRNSQCAGASDLSVPPNSAHDRGRRRHRHGSALHGTERVGSKASDSIDRSAASAMQPQSMLPLRWMRQQCGRQAVPRLSSLPPVSCRWPHGPAGHPSMCAFA